MPRKSDPSTPQTRPVGRPRTRPAGAVRLPVDLTPAEAERADAAAAAAGVSRPEWLRRAVLTALARRPNRR